MCICVVSGVLKDYLRELPEPLVTNALYQMMLDALSVRLPGDPDGSAKLMLSILECLPKSNQVLSNVNMFSNVFCEYLYITIFKLRTLRGFLIGFDI